MCRIYILCCSSLLSFITFSLCACKSTHVFAEFPYIHFLASFNFQCSSFALLPFNTHPCKSHKILRKSPQMTFCLLCAVRHQSSQLSSPCIDEIPYLICDSLSHLHTSLAVACNSEDSEVLKVSVVTHSRCCQLLCCNFVYTFFQHVMPSTHYHTLVLSFPFWLFCFVVFL